MVFLELRFEFWGLILQRKRGGSEVFTISDDDDPHETHRDRDKTRRVRFSFTTTTALLTLSHFFVLTCFNICLFIFDILSINTYCLLWSLPRCGDCLLD